MTIQTNAASKITDTITEVYLVSFKHDQLQTEKLASSTDFNKPENQLPYPIK